MKEVQPAWPAGIKRTKQRECVLDVLKEASSPLSAISIYEKIQARDDTIWLSTVYRVLELFEARGIIVKNTIMNHDMAVYELNRNEHKHYAVCIDCHKIVPIDNCPMESFVPKLAESDFHVLGHKVEMYGYCKDCDTKKK